MTPPKKPNPRKEIEEGVWIVYNLEANRKIQHLLTQEKFEFIFRHNLKIITEKHQAEIKELQERKDQELVVFNESLAEKDKKHHSELLSLAKEEHIRGYLDCARETISFLEMLEKGEVTIEMIKEHFKEAKK